MSMNFDTVPDNEAPKRALPSIQQSRLYFVRFMIIVWVAFVADLLYSFLFREITNALLIRKAPACFVGGMLPCAFLKAKRIDNDNIRDSTISLIFSICGIANTFSSLTVHPTRPMDQYAILLLVILATMNVKYWALISLTIIPAYIISTYNATFGLNGYAMWSIVEFDHGLPTEILAHTRTAIILPLAAFVINAQSCVYRDSVLGLERSVQLAKDVSEYLTAYNVKDAEETLQVWKSLQHDSELRNALFVIVENFKTYRPFLPNYIIAAKTTTTKMDHTEDEIQMDSVQHNRNSQGNLARLIMCASSEDFDDDDDDWEEDEDDNNSGHPLAPPPCHESNSSKNNNNSVRSIHQKAKARHNVQLLATLPVIRTVTFALCNFHVHNDDIISNPQTLRNFVEKAFKLVTFSAGGVHSWVGNTLQATWNAAIPTNNARQRSVTVIRALHDQTNSTHYLSSRVDVHSSIMTGTAQCHTTGGPEHLAFLIQTEWHNAQWELHRYAQRIQADVVCPKTAAGIRYPPVLPVSVLEESNVDVFELTTNEMYDALVVPMGLAMGVFKEGQPGEALRILRTNASVEMFAAMRMLPLSVQYFMETLQK
eukprot:PhF_6_TR35480/c0_g1_i1/m.51747